MTRGVVVPGYTHPVTQRGSYRQRTFFNKDDCRYYIERVAPFFLSESMYGGTCMPAAKCWMRALRLWLFGLGITGCSVPPEFVRNSDAGPVPADRSALHASYSNVDTLGVFPAFGRWKVRRVDGQEFTHPMLEQLSNRILLAPGVHGILFEADDVFGRSQWYSFEINAMPGHQYELSYQPGCPLSFRNNVVQKGHVNLTFTDPDGRQEQVTVPSICCYAEKDPGCRSDADCREGLICVVAGHSGFGLCGHTPD